MLIVPKQSLMGTNGLIASGQFCARLQPPSLFLPQITFSDPNEAFSNPDSLILSHDKKR